MPLLKLDQLPSVILEEIFCKLPNGESCINVSCVNKTFRVLMIQTRKSAKARFWELRRRKLTSKFWQHCNSLESLVVHENCRSVKGIYMLPFPLKLTKLSIFSRHLKKVSHLSRLPCLRELCVVENHYLLGRTSFWKCFGASVVYLDLTNCQGV